MNGGGVVVAAAELLLWLGLDVSVVVVAVVFVVCDVAAAVDHCYTSFLC